MTLNTYATLKTAIADWAWGEVTAALVDTDFFPQIWSAIYFGDKTGGVEIEPLRIRAMVSSATITPNASGQVTISTGVDSAWLDFIELTPVLAGAKSMQYVEPWRFRKEQDLLISTASPQFIYTIEGDTLSVAPKHTGNILAWYYEKFTALSADGDTDWLVLNAPQVYLNGGLMFAARYVQDVENEAKFRALFAGAIRGLNASDKMRQQSGSPLIARPRVVV